MAIGMPVAVILVPPFLIGFLLVMPVVPVPVIVILPDERLSMGISAILFVSNLVLIVMKIRLRLVHHHFITVEQVESVVAGRQFIGKTPMPLIHVNELVRRDIIIAMNVRDVIIFHVIIAARAPGRLNADVNRNADLGRGLLTDG
jgi:hypothetical protein